MPRRSCVFSGVRDSEVETKHWLMELSKDASCPIEENEGPLFRHLLQVMGLSLVRLNGREGVSGEELSVSRGRGARELRNLVSTINYNRRHEEVRGGNVSQ
ncbi:hypothetical protein CsSME_00008999 [Camellia sinensis var. sinensis]